MQKTIWLHLAPNSHGASASLKGKKVELTEKSIRFSLEAIEQLGKGARVMIGLDDATNAVFFKVDANGFRPRVLKDYCMVTFNSREESCKRYAAFISGKTGVYDFAQKKDGTFAVFLK